MIVAAVSMLVIIFLAVTGWKIALTDKLHEDAEAFADQRYKEYLRNTKYIVHFNQRIIDEMKRGDSK